MPWGCSDVSWHVNEKTTNFRHIRFKPVPEKLNFENPSQIALNEKKVTGNFVQYNFNLQGLKKVGIKNFLLF